MPGWVRHFPTWALYAVATQRSRKLVWVTCEHGESEIRVYTDAVYDGGNNSAIFVSARNIL